MLLYKVLVKLALLAIFHGKYDETITYMQEETNKLMIVTTWGPISRMRVTHVPVAKKMSILKICDHTISIPFLCFVHSFSSLSAIHIGWPRLALRGLVRHSASAAMVNKLALCPKLAVPIVFVKPAGSCLRSLVWPSFLDGVGWLFEKTLGGRVVKTLALGTPLLRTYDQVVKHCEQMLGSTLTHFWEGLLAASDYCSGHK